MIITHAAVIRLLAWHHSTLKQEWTSRIVLSATRTGASLWRLLRYCRHIASEYTPPVLLAVCCVYWSFKVINVFYVFVFLKPVFIKNIYSDVVKMNRLKRKNKVRYRAWNGRWDINVRLCWKQRDLVSAVVNIMMSRKEECDCRRKLRVTADSVRAC